MKKPNLFKIVALALGCAALAATTIPSKADRLGDRGPRAHLVNAHAGTTFTPLTPIDFDAQGNPTKFSHTVDGVVRVSLLGNCTVHFDVVAMPRPDGTFALAGTLQITAADGQTNLNADVEGATSPEPDNALMGNFHYDVKFTGGTGAMARASGKADIDGFLLFNEGFAGGKATWIMQGVVLPRGHRH
jgi:hypothetical protein